jgi:hypothetical protein
MDDGSAELEQWRCEVGVRWNGVVDGISVLSR